LQGLYLASTTCKDYAKSLPIVLAWGKKQSCGKKSKLGQKKQFEKSNFLGFMPKALPILDFGVHHWKKAKNKPLTKIRTFQNVFVNFLLIFVSIPHQLLNSFLDFKLVELLFLLFLLEIQ